MPPIGPILEDLDLQDQGIKMLLASTGWKRLREKQWCPSFLGIYLTWLIKVVLKGSTIFYDFYLPKKGEQTIERQNKRKRKNMGKNVCLVKKCFSTQ